VLVGADALGPDPPPEQPVGTWRDEPEIVDPADNVDEPTDFEATIAKLAKNHNLWSHCERADRAAGIGQHGLLLIGFKDVADEGREAWETDATDKFSSPSDILTLKPVTEAQIEDIDYGDMEDGERWGKPVEYTIDLGDDTDSDMISTGIELTPEQTEALARDLFEQATAARENRESGEDD